MSTPEDYLSTPNELSLVELQEEVFGRGWVYAYDDEYGVGEFERGFARVNPLLAGRGWKEVARAGVDVIRDATMDIGMGMSITTRQTETEVYVGVIGRKEDLDTMIDVHLMDQFLRQSGFEEIDEEMLAEWLILKGDPSGPAPNTKAFYEQFERSAELRKLCLRMLVDYTAVVATAGMESESMGRLIELNHRLAELAIEPDMHTGRKPSEIADPIGRTEWLAGQLRLLLARGDGFSGNARAILQEHNQLAGTGLVAIGPEAGEDALRSMFLLMSFENLSAMLDANAEEI